MSKVYPLFTVIISKRDKFIKRMCCRNVIFKTCFGLKNDNAVLVWQLVKQYWGHYTEMNV